MAPPSRSSAQTTDKLLFAVDNGRFYTLGADKLPGARGFGEPVRTMIDIDPDAQIVALVAHKPEGPTAAGGQYRTRIRGGNGRSCSPKRAKGAALSRRSRA